MRAGGDALSYLALLALLVAHAAPVAAAPAFPEAAARAIAIAEDRRQFEGLKPYLRDPSPAVRARAALAVGRLQDSTTVRDLLPLLGDRAAEVRREAAFALGQIGHRSARESIEARLVDTDAETVELAIEALGKLGDRAATRRVVDFLSDPAPARRSAAAVALWRLADSTALDVLLARHSDREPEVRWRVLYALEKIVAPERIVLVAAAHLNAYEPVERAYAARTLGRQRSPRALTYLFQSFGDPEVAVAVNALRAIQQIDDTTCARCGRMTGDALASDHPYVRSVAATVLGERATTSGGNDLVRRAVADSLRAHLTDPDAATRGACARSLLRLHRDSVLAVVRPVLDDASVYARVGAMAGLTALRSETPARELRSRLEPRRDLLERMTAADLLGEIKAREAVEVLRAGVADSSMLFAASCAGALAAMGDSASVPALAAAYAARAGDADADARIAVRDALRDLAGRAFADSLERAHPARNAAPAQYAADFAVPPAERGAILHTTAGEIEWEFFGREAPQTVKNFVRLARRGYFDGLRVHRVVPNFVIQDGDPTGTGSGGPGYTIRCEYNRLHYEPGMVGMALSGKDTGGSQWFITHSPQPHLDGRYTIFARVVRGLDVARNVVQGDRIERVEILTGPASAIPGR